MSAPLIWIIFPALLSLGFLFISGKPKLVRGLAISAGLLLSLLAIFQPIGGLFKAGLLSIEIKSSLIFLGRAFILDNSDRFVLSLIFLTFTLFVAASNSIRVEQKFIPLSLAISAILTATLAVEPFLYSAILVELAVLVMIPLASRKGNPGENGLLYFLIYLSLAMPFILLSGWVLGGLQADPSDEIRLTLAAILLGIGFSLWLGVFPFHSWIPKISESVHPYIVGYLFSLLPVVMLMVMINYISGLVWLRETEYLPEVLRFVGIIMIVTGGVFAAVEKETRRIVALSVIFETGFALLLVSFLSTASVHLLYISFLPRIAGVILATLSLSVFYSANVETTLAGIQGQIRRYPFASIGLLTSLFSIVGFPLLGGFPVRIEVFKLIGNAYPVSLIWMLLGTVGFLISILTLVSRISHLDSETWTINETLPQSILICFGIITLLFMGLFPHLVSDLLASLLSAIPVLQ